MMEEEKEERKNRGRAKSTRRKDEEIFRSCDNNNSPQLIFGQRERRMKETSPHGTSGL